jgi:hypothetical protein
MRLKDKANHPVSQLGEPIFRECGDIDSVDENSASSGYIQSAQDIQQSGFSAAGLTHDGNKLAQTDLNIDAMQDRGVDFPEVCFPQTPGFNHSRAESIAID